MSMSGNRIKVPVILDEMGAPVLQYLCDELASLMKENNAPNFLGMQMQDNNGDDWMVTIQRVSGETPEEQCKRLKKELSEIKIAALAVVRFWEDAKASFSSEDVAMPLGLSVEPVQSENWVDIKSSDLDKLASLALGMTCAQRTTNTEEQEAEV